MKGLRENDHDWDYVRAANSWDQVQDGSLGFAFQQILNSFGVPADASYDYTCASTRPWPAVCPSGNEPLFLKANPDLSISCVFTDERTEYSAYQEGEAKRCFTDQDGTERAKLTATRRAAITYAGASCILWDENQAWHYPYNSYACLVNEEVPLENEEEPAEYLIFECLLQARCTNTNPLDDQTGAWVSASEEEYRVVSPPYQEVSELPCVDVETMRVDYPRLNLHADSDNDPDGYITYLCYLGLPYECAVTAEYSIHDDSPACLVPEGDPETLPNWWTPVEGALGRLEPTFTEKYPECLDATDYHTEPTAEEAEANLEFLRRECLTEATESVKPRDSLADSATDAFELSIGTPLHVSRYGALCFDSVHHSDNERSQFLHQIKDAVFDASIIIDSATPAEDYPQNVLNAMQYVSQELFNEMVANESTEGLLEYWDFIEAIARVPRFCNAELSGSYGQFGQQQMCGKELAAFLANAIAETNELNFEKTTEDGTTVPLWQQGFHGYGDAVCSQVQFTSEARCMAYNSAEGFLTAKCAELSCSTTQLYYPRGAGGLQGVSDYYWYGRLVAGNDDILQDPSAVVATGSAFWLTGLFKWMVSLDGRPSAHSIMTGVWSPQTIEIEQGISLGFGAIIALNYGDAECASIGNVRTDVRTSIYEEMIEKLSVSETVLSGVEINHCQGAARASWPQEPSTKDYGTLSSKIYLTGSYIDEDGAEQGNQDNKCFFTATPTEMIIYEKDAYRQCAWQDKNP